MKTFTPERRRDIYLKVSKIIFDKWLMKEDAAVCLELRDIANKIINPERFLNLSLLFPEFFLYEQPTRRDGRTIWWNYNSKGAEQRVMALLFAAEMTKTEKL